MVIKKYLTKLSEQHDKFCRITVNGSSFTITSGRVGTFGKSSVHSFSDSRECLCEVDKLIGMRIQKGYVESDEDIMEEHALPQELKDSLSKSRTFHTGHGRFRRIQWHDALLTCVVVNPARGHDMMPTGHSCENITGVFCTAAYALTVETGDRPRAVLVWLPNISLYGAWYPKDRQLVVFPGTRWAAIEKNLAAYLWARETGAFPYIQCHLKLSDHFDFIPDNFPARVGNILALQDDVRQKRIDEFLLQYERVLRRVPFCNEMADTFESLVTLYYRTGLLFEGLGDYRMAIPWFKKSLHIINQSHHLRCEVFSDVFLQLGFCCLETSRFDTAIRYINIYQRYDASAWEACDQIKASIRRSQQLYKETMNSYLRKMERGSFNGQEKVNGFIEKTVRSFPNDPVLHFNLACFFAVSERISDALYHFEEALKKGFTNREKMLTERDLQNVKHTRAFEDIRLKYL